ncbi:TPA: transporter, partial [Escherichia coli]
MTDNILEVMDTLSDRMITLQTRINQAYSDLCDYT